MGIIGKTSTNKLGHAAEMIAVPMEPSAAQIKSGYLHLRLAGGDGYVAGVAKVSPSRLKTVMASYKAAVDGGNVEPSYSGTGSKYVPLAVTKVDGTIPGLFALMLGTEEVARVLVDPAAEIISTDEPLKDQIEDGDGEED